jgi:hypothetical protein
VAIQTQNLGQRTLLDLQQDLAALRVDELRAFLGALAGMGLPIPPVLALSQVALTGGPLISKTYAREEWLDLLRASRCFSASWSRAAGGVGTLSYLQLWNPANSGVTALIYALEAFSSSAYPAGTFMTDALDTVTAPNPTTPSFVTNLKAGGPAPQCQTRDGIPGALPTVAQAPRIAERPALTAFGFVDFQLVGSGAPQGFIAEVPPGFGLDVLAGLANSSLFGYVRWAEVPPTY